MTTSGGGQAATERLDALMPSTQRMHDQIALGHFGHNFYNFGKIGVVDSKMLHGIKMEADSNPAVVHGRHYERDQFLGRYVNQTRPHRLLVVGPVRL